MATEKKADLGTCTALELLPVCPSNSQHGYMELRPLARQTKEQRWCGVWYDCKEAHCRSSVLYQSAELRAQLAEQIDRIKVDYDALPTKRQKARFLQGCVPWVAAKLQQVNPLYRN